MAITKEADMKEDEKKMCVCVMSIRNSKRKQKSWTGNLLIHIYCFKANTIVQQWNISRKTYIYLLFLTQLICLLQWIKYLAWNKNNSKEKILFVKKNVRKIIKTMLLFFFSCSLNDLKKRLIVNKKVCWKTKMKWNKITERERKKERNDNSFCFHSMSLNTIIVLFRYFKLQQA